MRLSRVVVATHNAHKVAELQRILTPLLPGVALEAYDGPEPVEDGDTFEANAITWAVNVSSELMEVSSEPLA